MPTPEDVRLVLHLVAQYGCGEHLSTLAEAWAEHLRRRKRRLVWTTPRDNLRLYPNEIAHYAEGFFMHNSMRLDYAWDRWFDREAYRNGKAGGWRTIATGSTQQIHEQAQDYVNAGGPYGGPTDVWPGRLEFGANHGHHSFRARANSGKGISYYRWRPDHWADELTVTVWPHGRVRLDAHKTPEDALKFIREFDEWVEPDEAERKAPLGGQPVGVIDYWRITDGVCFVAQCDDVRRNCVFLLCPITSGLAAVFVYKPRTPNLELHCVIPTPSGLIRSVCKSDLGYAVDERKHDALTSERLAPLRRSLTPVEPPPDPRPDVFPNDLYSALPRGRSATPRPCPPDVVPYKLRVELLNACGLSGMSRALAHRHFQYVPIRIPVGTKGRVVAAALWRAILESSARGRPRLEGSWRVWTWLLVHEGYLAKVPGERAIQGALRELEPRTPVFERVRGKGNGYWIVHRDKLREMPAEFLIAIKVAEAAYTNPF